MVLQKTPMPDHRYLHALRLVPHIGPKTLAALIDHFGDAEAAWHATDLSGCSISEKAKTSLRNARHTVDPDAEWETLQTHAIRLLARTDAEYPRLLKEIPDAPYVLYARGSYTFDPKPLITIVGSRQLTDYGERVTRTLATDLVRAGCGVVSGLAFGIDAVAHRAALEAGGETIAVLGNGLDDASIAPQSHLSLAHAILPHGALLSEYPLGTKAETFTFPARNRIMAGMSLGTVVVEAAEGSGTLITARLALDYNREVFAVPGSIFSSVSVGTHRLIKEGAVLVASVRDILEALPLARASADPAAPDASAARASLSPDEACVFALLSREPLHIDNIAKLSKLGTSQVNSLLALMEIQGIVRNIGGMNYIKM